MSALILQIQQLDQQRGWEAAWYLGETPVGEPFLVVGSATQTVRDAGRWFVGLFERGTRPLEDPEELRAIGRMLSEVWFRPAWPSIEPRLGDGPHHLFIRSQDREVLNLPWELVEVSEG